MEKKLTQKELLEMRRMADRECRHMQAIKTLLDGDRHHEQHLKASLTFYLACVMLNFDDPAFEGIRWKDYFWEKYNELLASAESRFGGLGEDVRRICSEMDRNRQKGNPISQSSDSNEGPGNEQSNTI